MESAVLRAFEMRRVPEKAVFGTEYLFRTGKACFLHRMYSENASRTVGSLFEHGTHIPYRRSLFLVPSPLTQRHFSRPLFVDISIP